MQQDRRPWEHRARCLEPSCDWTRPVAPGTPGKGRGNAEAEAARHVAEASHATVVESRPRGVPGATEWT